MEDLDLLINLHIDGARQGPGDDQITRQAIQLAGLDSDTPLNIADIGSGTGASTLVLAQSLNAKITAVDFLPDFLKKLRQSVETLGISDRIQTVEASMDSLPFDKQQFDVIWSEGAIYNMGFDKGITDWRRFLKPGGILAVSEITWLTAARPEEVDQFWTNAYPEIDTASAKIAQLEARGYSPIGYFTLPEHCWLENYYRPLQGRYEAFLEAYNHSETAKGIVEGEKAEIALYKKYKSFFSYGFYIARKTKDN